MDDPGKVSGCKVTIRDMDPINELLKKLFVTIDNQISSKKIAKNHVSFGIKEYIEVPGFEYQREIGILGFEIDIVFKRKGKSVKFRKIKTGKYPEKQAVTKEEIVEYLNKNYGVEVV